MFQRFKRWYASKRGKDTVITVLAIALVISIVGQVVGWSNIGRLLAGTTGPGLGGYSCMPTCVEDDGKFLSMPGEDMASFGGASIILWIEAPIGQSSFEIGIFDGDSGKLDDGSIDPPNGNWDDTDIETTYTLYADPSRDGSGTVVVGEWKGNTDPMPNNDWYDITVDDVEAARSSDGKYYYRLECTRPVEGVGINAFKLRSAGQLTSGRSDLADSNFAIVGMMGSLQDVPIIYPEFQGDYTNPGPSAYSGEWEFYFDVPAGTDTISFWDGDFDRGTERSATRGDVDTDDLNTTGKPDWALPSALNERAGGRGNPADDYFDVLYRVSPPAYYEVLGPDGQPIFTNDNPSGTEEWEEFVVSKDTDLPDDQVDLRVETIPPGVYTLHIVGLDLHNTVWFRIDYEIRDQPPDDCPECPTCPDCPVCVPCDCAEPTDTPEPDPTDTPEPELPPEPEPCEDAAPIDLLYVLDVSGSMKMLYPGSGTKLQAAQRAIKKLNEWVAEQDNGSRVALLTFHSAGTGQGHPPVYPTDVKIASEFTADINAFNAVVDGLRASGGTPTAEALNLAASWLPGAWDANHVPVVILVSDGVPTVDLETYGFNDYEVQKVGLYDQNGNSLTAEQVRQKGKNFPEYGQKAGEPLADTMLAIQNLMAAVPDAQVHAVAVQADQHGIFNDDVLKYVATQGNGQFFMAKDSDQLVVAFQWAFVDSACEGQTPPPGEPKPPAGCENPRRVQYNVENTTNNPFYGIKFEYKSGPEIKRGAYDEFSFVLTKEEAAAMQNVQVEAKAGRNSQTTQIGNCAFDQPQACDPVKKRSYTFTFLGAEDNGDGTLTLTFRVQNDRRNALSHATIGLSGGVKPSTPTNFYESEVCP